MWEVTVGYRYNLVGIARHPLDNLYRFQVQSVNTCHAIIFALANNLIDAVNARKHVLFVSKVHHLFFLRAPTLQGYPRNIDLTLYKGFYKTNTLLQKKLID